MNQLLPFDWHRMDISIQCFAKSSSGFSFTSCTVCNHKDIWHATNSCRLWSNLWQRWTSVDARCCYCINAGLFTEGTVTSCQAAQSSFCIQLSKDKNRNRRLRHQYCFYGNLQSNALNTDLQHSFAVVCLFQMNNLNGHIYKVAMLNL